MKKVIALSLFCLTFFALNTEAKACEAGAKCAVPRMPDAVRYADAIFSGKVIGVEQNGTAKIFTIQVSNYWKGAVKRKVKVTIAESMIYQAWYNKGESYLFYTRIDKNGNLSDGRCTASKRLSEAKEDLKYLGRGKKPKG